MIFLGIDGGGSKTKFLLEDDGGRQLASFESGPSNWLSSGPEQTRRSLAEGSIRLKSSPDIVSGGFAGAGRPDGIAFYQESLASLFPKARIFVETDAFMTYVGALGIQPGVLLLAGTGSLALARPQGPQGRQGHQDGTMVRVGGWGPTFSDEGGGFWIGREVIAAALRTHDAEESAEFSAMIARRLNLQSITEIPTAWKSGTVDVHAVASLARFALENPEMDMPYGKDILERAAHHLRSLVDCARKRAGLPENCPMAVSGSVGEHPVMKQKIGLPFVPALHSPCEGAIRWARDRIRAS